MAKCQTDRLPENDKKRFEQKKLTVCRFVLGEKLQILDAWNGLNTPFHNSVSQVEQGQLSIVTFFRDILHQDAKGQRSAIFGAVSHFFQKRKVLFPSGKVFSLPRKWEMGLNRRFLFSPPPPLNEMSIAKGEEEKEEEATSAVLPPSE